MAVAKTLYAVIVRRIESYRLLVEIEASSSVYADREVNAKAIRLVKSGREEGVESLGEVYEVEHLMKTLVDKPQEERG